MSKEFYNYLREDTQGVMSGPSTADEFSQYRIVAKVLKEFAGGVDDV